jgi:anti-anti-sigma factor
MSTSTGTAGNALGGGPHATPTHPLLAQFTTRWLQPSTPAISVCGEIDASNACDLIAYTLRYAHQAQHLVLDLSGVGFYGTEGFSALHVINVGCARANARWVVVPSRAVTRVVGICDPDCTLPTADSVDSALAALQNPSHRLLQLVSAPR